MNYEKIYKEHADNVFRFILKLSGDEHIAEEVTQECFYRAYKNSDKYDGTCKFSVWLCQIAKNIYFDYCKKKKSLSIDEEINFLESISFEEVLCNKDVAKSIYKIIHTLEEPYKEVFMLKVFGECSYKDISDIFGKSENWARVTFFRAKAKILISVQNANLSI